MERKDAIEVIKSNWPDSSFTRLREALETLIPELKESEDERIKKQIIYAIKELHVCDETKRKCIAWLEKQGEKDKLIKELGEYKAKYTQEVLEKHINSIGNKDDERLRKTTISFLKDFADKGYENAVECIDWLKAQGLQNLANSAKTCKEEHINFIEKIQIGDQVTRNEDGVLVNLSQLKRVAKKVIEDKESATKFLKSTGIMNESGKLAEQYRQGEQKPAMIQWKGDNLKEVIDFTGKSPKFDEWFNTWSDFENYVHSHNDILKLFCEDGSHYEVPVGAWIVRTPDGYNVASQATYKQKSAWSEEDEKEYRRVEYAIMKVFGGDTNLIGWIRKFKNKLLHHTAWKPSDEQIISLQEAIGI